MKVGHRSIRLLTAVEYDTHVQQGEKLLICFPKTVPVIQKIELMNYLKRNLNDSHDPFVIVDPRIEYLWINPTDLLRELDPETQAKLKDLTK